MSFNSFTFLFFVIVTFFCYWSIPNKEIKKQNVLLLLASYIFYGFWDWRFLGLIIFSSFVDYFCSIFMVEYANKTTRKTFLIISLVSNLGLLGFFKYYNFFAESLQTLFVNISFSTNIHSLNIILPVGISFYTFQSLSYTIDVYRKEQEVCRDPWTFLAYVAFFPQLVAGPIERSKNLLRQFVAQGSF